MSYESHSRATTTVISLDAIAYNVMKVRELVGSDTDVMMVIKADGYGHGAVAVAPVAASNNISMFGVATPHEGRELRENGVVSPILTLGATIEDELEIALDARLELTVASKHGLDALSRRAGSRGNGSVKVHVKVDTGMGRLGFFPDEVAPVVGSIVNDPNLDLGGVFTHFPSAEIPDDEGTKTQISEYTTLIDRLRENGLPTGVRHAANTSATLCYPESRLDMVRVGIMLYGVLTASTLVGMADLRPALTFTSRIVHLRRMPTGRTISYGRTFTTQRETLVATLPVGYADGFPAQLSNNFSVIVGGRKAPILGRVCMDQTCIDVTDVPDVRIRDAAVLIGEQGGEAITVEEMADAANMIPYEILCGISKRVPRVYEGGHA
ncbi:alanine racemase [Candidatus Hydrogenedentota bacterium]